MLLHRIIVLFFIGSIMSYAACRMVLCDSKNIRNGVDKYCKKVFYCTPIPFL